MSRMLLEHRPAPPLASYVESLWYCEGYQVPHRQERVLPNGRFQLIIDLANGFSPMIIGMQSRYSVIQTAAIQSMIGVVFWPGGARAVLPVPAEEFFNRAVPLDSIWRSAAAELRDRLCEAPDPQQKFRILEADLQRRAEQRIQLHPSVLYALKEFRRQPHARGILEVASETRLSRRRFAQLFREQVGVTPKLYCRLRRFQQVVRQIAAGQPVDWADVALSGGYSDQSHMSHEFREFSGFSPGAYLASKRPFPNHVAIE